MKYLILLISFALTTACTSITTSTGSKPITLLLARQIVPQKTSSAEMKQLIGAPDSVLQTSEFDPTEIWVYLKSTEPATRRMYAFVNKKSGLVESVTWNVFDREPESSLDFVKKELGNPELTRTEPKWDKGDSAPDEVYFKTTDQRLTIVLRRTLNEVDMVQWR